MVLSVELVFVSPSYFPASCTSLTPLAMCCTVVIVFSLPCTTSCQETAAWGQHLGPKSWSEEEGSGSASIAAEELGSAQSQAPGLHLKDEVEGHRDRCTLCTEENTTDATLERARERNKLFI